MRAWHSKTLPPKPSLQERFWQRVQKTDDCWLWLGGADGHGYGQFYIGDGKTVLAHRYAYEQCRGAAPALLDHRPTCPRLCVRPDHVRSATAKQNQENRIGPQYNSRSGVRGVYPHSDGVGWVAQVGHRGRRIYVGWFRELADAETAVIAKRNELHTHNDLDRML